MLPDDVLLEIFDFYVVEAMEYYPEEHHLKHKWEAWQTLVHVYRRWRSVVFGSPCRLDLRLFCTTKTTTDTLDIWPVLPLVIEDGNCQNEDMGNIIALLERRDVIPRVTLITLFHVHLEDILEVMEVPFPELTYLSLRHSHDETVPVIPDSFLGGSVPQLEYLNLDNIPFPGLPELLSSSTHLICLFLSNIPHSGYISPDAMLACLPLLTSLERLSLRFQSPQSRPDRESRRPPPSTRTVLPVLTHFAFKGDSEYLEALVARIDAPQLDFFRITFFNDVVFDAPQITRLISDMPTFNAFDEASVFLGGTVASIKLSSKASSNRELQVKILCRELDWQVSFLEQVYTSSLFPLFTLEDLYIDEYRYRKPVWEDNIDNTLWLELLHLFTTVRNLFLSEKIASRVVPALQELVGGRTIEVLPTLQNAFIEGLQPSGPVQESLGKFVAARQLTGHPIAVYPWDRE